MSEPEPSDTATEADTTSSEMTDEEYENMRERIRAELIEELKHNDDREERERKTE